MRFNSILGAMVFIVVASIVAFLVFIQTNSFGRLATKVISDIAQKKAQTQVSIKSIQLKLFPPGVELNKVSVKKDLQEGESVFAEFGKLGFYIGLVELEEKKLTFGEIRISDSVIDYKFVEQNEEPIKEIPQDVINKIFDVTHVTPLRVDTLLLENSRIFLNHDLLEAKRLKVFKKNDNFMFRFHLANLQPDKDLDFKVDEIWGDVEVGRSNAKIYRLKVQHDVHTLLLKGNVTSYPKLLASSADLTGEAYLYLKNIPQEVKIPEDIKVESGLAHLSFNVAFKNKKINGNALLGLDNLRSNIIYADQIDAEFDFSDELLDVKKMNLAYKDERLELLKPTTIYDFKRDLLLPNQVDAKLENVSLNNALRILGPSLSPLKGQLSGKINFKYVKGNYYFTPSENFVFKNLGLVVGEENPFTVLMIKKGSVSAGHFNVVNNEFQMDSIFNLEKSKLHVKGFVNEKKVDFESAGAKVNFEDFGNISKLNIKGQGVIDLNVEGDLNDTIINLKGMTENFEVLGYHLGKSDKNISISLKDSSVIIEKLESQLGNTKLSGTGAVNYDNMDIALDIKSQQAYYPDLEIILQPIFSEMTFLPKDLDLNAKVDATIYGKASLKDLKIKSQVNFNDLQAYGESFRNGKFQVDMKDEMVSILNLEAYKGEGNVEGDFSYSMKTKKIRMDYRWDNLALESFNIGKKVNLNLMGKLSGSLIGEGSTDNYLLYLKGKMFDTRSATKSFDDSNYDLTLRPNRIAGDINLLGDIIRSSFDRSLNKKQASRFKVMVDAPEIKPFLSALLGQHIDAEDITGKLKFNLDSNFQDEFTHLSLQANVMELVFSHEDFKVDYHSTKPQLVVEDSQIKKWDLNIQQKDIFVTSKGSGVFGKEVSLIHDIHFNSKILEIVLAPLLSAEGFIRNSVRIDGKGDKFFVSLTSRAEDLDLTVENIPFPLNNISYNVDYTQNKLFIQELTSNLENGTVSLKGDVFFDDSEPDVNIRYVLDKAEIPLFGKSTINISGEGILLGNNRPYNLGGDISINKAQIVNELNDFNSKSTALGQARFLPKNQESTIEKIVNLNLNVKADNPVRIANSLMDVVLKGEVNLTGSPIRPKGEGHLYAPPNTSRIFFKNNEYFITSADINFSSKKEITNPDFDVQAYTIISNYKVYPKAFGDLERFNFDLTSDPPLTRNSIFSLIAFGYTDELQNSLDPKEQQKLSQVGVGSFVFDRFKISDILNKQFGLQVNLGTVFEQSQSSMLSGRTQEGQGTLGRVRSATKLELKKRLNEATTLSVSSTMGGDIGQRQSMNLNYGVSKKVQLEGVYEVRTNADGQEDVIDNSIGGDVKFRWTFK